MIPTRFAWERALRADETVPWHLKSVLLLLATYMSNDGSEARPSVPTLARQSGLSRARVFELLRQAGERGWVQSVSAPGKVTVRLPQIPDPSCPPDGSGSTTRPTHGTGQEAQPVLPTGRVDPSYPRDGSSPPDGTRPAHRTRQVQDRKKSVAEPTRDDVTQLCEALRERILANGSKCPPFGDNWRKDARLLLDRDERDHAEALLLIEWCQQHEFWQSNILSMPKFRAQYDKLRLQAQRDPSWRRRLGGVSTNVEINPDDVLGPDLWQPPAPPDEINDGPDDVRARWFREQRATHTAARVAEAREVLHRRHQLGATA